MTVHEIIDELGYYRGKGFPYKAAEEAINNQAEIIPYLLKLLEEVIANPSKYASDENYTGHFFAMYLLARFREAKAYPLIHNLCLLDSEITDALLGEFTTDGLQYVLFSVCGDDDKLIKELIENNEIDEYIRESCLEVLVFMVKEGIKTRKEVIEYFKYLFDYLPDDSQLFNELTYCSALIYPGEVIDTIKELYLAGKVDPDYLDFEDIKESMELGEAGCINRLPELINKSYVKSVVLEMEGWHMYKSEYEEEEEEYEENYLGPEDLPDDFYLEDDDGEYYEDEYDDEMESYNIGLNSRCPCGSGEKFKDCCGKPY